MMKSQSYHETAVKNGLLIAGQKQDICVTL